MESILITVKKFLNLDQEHEFFDPEIIMLINSAFATLDQIGEYSVFKIEDKSSKWSDYTEDVNLQSLVKEYICIKVKQSFDPNASSNISQIYSERIAELEWRINAYADPWFKKEES